MPNAVSAPRPTVIVGAGHGLPAVPRVAAPGGAGRGTDGLKADHQPPGSVPTTDGDADRLSGDSEDSSPPPGSATGDDSLGGLGAAAAAGEQVEKLLADAWGLIERGDHQVGRRVLLEARRAGRNDLRSDFSLGLLDALVVHDWPSAEKHFVQCARREPGHIASLNNLALVRLRTAWGKTALRTWEEVLDQGVPPSEVVQNLGRLRHLVQAGKVPKRTKDAKLAEAVEQLYIRAATAANQSAQPHMGFLFMGMKRADNRTIGWSDAKKYEDAWCLVCLGKGQVKCPNANCLRGTVKAPAFQGGGRVTCDSCGGYAAMACKACINGKDRDVRWTPTAPMYRTIGAGVTVPVPQPGINVGPLGPVMSPFAPRK